MALKKLCIYILIVFGGWYWFTSAHQYEDRFYGCDISIRPSLTEWNTKNIKAGLAALKKGDSERYTMVCENVKKIKLNPSCGGWGGGCFYGATDEIHISTANDEFLGWTAAIIVHEACHSLQENEGRPIAEDECYSAGHQTLTTLVEHEMKTQ